MSEHQRETAFLRRCLRWGGNCAEYQALDQRIIQIQRDERSVLRAVWVMVGFAALAVAGLGYSAVLVENFPQDMSQLMVKSIAALGLASLMCVVVFVGLRKIYRMKLNQRREECRQLVTKLLESRLGKSAGTPPRERPLGADNRTSLADTVGGTGAPGELESPLQAEPS